MDNNTAAMLINVIMFSISCAFDLVFFVIIAGLCYLLFRTKKNVSKNSVEIHNLDKVIFKLEQAINSKG